MEPLALSLVLLSAWLHAVWSVAIKASDDPLLFDLLQLVAPSLALLGLFPWLGPGVLPGASFCPWCCVGAPLRNCARRPARGSVARSSLPASASRATR